MIGDLFDSPWKILIVAVVLIVLFGSKKLPDAARSLGKSMRILKTEVHDLHGDDEAAKPAPEPQAAVTPPAVTAAAPALPSQQQIDQLQQQINDLQRSAAAAPAPAQSAPLTETQRTQQPS
jgi:sec-independent protein translocase protein TatA